MTRRRDLLRVGIDLTALLPLPTGVDRCLTSLVAHLARLDRDTRYTLFVNGEDRRRIAAGLPANFTVVPASLRPRPVRLAFQQALLPLAAAALGLDVLHSPSFIMPLVRARAHHLLTVHDMTMFTMGAYHIPLRRSAPFLAAVAASIRRAHLVSVPTHAVRADVLRLLPDVPAERIRVVAPGIGEEFCPADGGGTATARRPYVLFVGTLEPRKNVEGLLASYRALIAENGIAEDLVLAGRLGWDYERILAAARSPELAGRVHVTGYVSAAELLALYRGARLFVYPSHQEGFGFPPLEALACGVPTIATDTPALVENLADAADLVPPDDPAALTAAMRRLLRDEAWRATLRTRGLARAATFRWDETARQTHACYEELAGR